MPVAVETIDERKELEEQTARAQALAQSNASLYTELNFGDQLDDWQRDALAELSAGRDVAVRACNGAGKERLCAAAMHWFLQTRKPSIVVSTSASWRQVSEQLWGEYRSLWERKRFEMLGDCKTTTHDVGPKWFATGFSTDDGGRYEGYHQTNILLVMSEAKSLSRDIFTAVDRCRSTGDRIQQLVVSTTGSRQSPFADCFEKEAARFSCFHVPARARPGTKYVTTRVKQSWVAEMVKKFGEGSAMVKSMIDAEFYDQSETDSILLEWVQAAMMRALIVDVHEPTRIGCDVARSTDGDETTIYVTKAGKQIDKKIVKVRDTMAVAGWVIQLMRQYNVAANYISIDDTGVGGGVVDKMREEGYAVNAVQFGGTANDNAIFCDRSSELWWLAHEEFKYGRVQIDKDDELLAQLTTRNFLPPDGRGRMKIESKDSLRERHLPSPDRADGLILSLVGVSQPAVLRVGLGVADPSGVLTEQQKAARSTADIKEIIRRAQEDADKQRGEKGVM